MTPGFVVDMLNQAIHLIVLIVTVMVLPSLVIGLLVAIFQAATSIQEQTLSFLPRFVMTILMLGFMGHWIFGRITAFMLRIFHDIPYVVG